MRSRALLFAALGIASWHLAPTSVVAAPVRQGTVDVTQHDNVFDPATITVATGTTVRWTNSGANQHTTTSIDGLWDSGTMSPGATFSFTFSTPGRYGYLCEFHDELGMVGTVVVTAPATAPPSATRPAAATATAAATRVTGPPTAPTATAVPGATLVAPAATAPAATAAATAAPEEVAPPEPQRARLKGDRYVIMPGDTLSALALQFGVSVMDLARANGIRNPDLIFAGAVLVIPRSGDGDCFAYRVRYGDTVYDLALRYETTVRAIARVNGINPHRIYAGQRLLICGEPHEEHGDW
jgi:plastocyanin